MRADDCGEAPSLADFHDTGSTDLFDKCRKFGAFVGEVKRQGLYQAQYRVTLEGALDHRIQVRNPFTGHVQEMVCFDSNSYLGLHLHPRVRDATVRAIEEVGYGTPSAQLLGGTNRYLRELEETVSWFYGREDTVIFPSGYATNVGTLTALLRPDDLVARDRFAHASIHDGCRWSGARWGGIYQHADPVDLERLLEAHASNARGKLIVTDGVFSMHGKVADLPALRAVADRHGARLMVDEAHALGVFGASGRGLEEHFALPGSIDILMGTFSKAPGSVGGYVTGDRDMVEYLRFFARSCMFTAALPAPICAGLAAAFQVMHEEPQLRERLWANTTSLWEGLHAAGLPVGPLESPILTVFAGHERLLWAMSRDLFDAGIKVGNVSYPAVPRGESILRISVSARHDAQDIERAVEALARIGTRYGLLGRGKEEIQASGLALGAATGAR